VKRKTFNQLAIKNNKTGEKSMKAQSSAMTIVLVFAIFFGMAFQCDSNEDGGVTDNSGRQPSNKAALDEVGDINLPPLAAKPGYIVGRAFLADGRPIPSFKVGAVGYDGKAHVMNTGVPSLGEVEGRNGRYSLQTTYAYDRSEPVSATVIGVSATTKVNYSGEEFTIFLHPVDGKKKRLRPGRLSRRQRQRRGARLRDENQRTQTRFRRLGGKVCEVLRRAREIRFDDGRRQNLRLRPFFDRAERLDYYRHV
jgi:hypothetical protein